MNKKFLSAILFGALMVTSTGTFVSCKDYDDDIENLRGQINNLATKSDVEAKLSQLQAAIDAAKAESAANAAKIAALTKCECDVDAMMATIQNAVDADMAQYKTEIEALVAEVEALVGKVADFVTSVELFSSAALEGGFPRVLDFFTITEKENVFEEEIAGAIEFTKGKQTQVAKTPILVRVSPTNAVLTPEMISLVNSKGENLDEYVDIAVAPYSELLTRSAEKTGLWEIKVTLKEYDGDQLAGIKATDDGDILYAVQVNNALSSVEARYITSSYDVVLGDHFDFEPVGTLDFDITDANGETHNISTVNNRYSKWNNPSLPNGNASSYSLYEELTWLPINEPATEPVLSGDDKNVQKNGVDNRADKPVVLAVQGEPIGIAITEDDKEKIAAIYVTLDKQKNAVESAPSEWNAWNSYEYTGLDQVVEGTSTTITIDGEETINDYIGFRVYAVNYDGTLVDPDGRAFYVLVGEQAQELNVAATTITPVNEELIATEAVATEALADLEGVVDFTWSMDDDEAPKFNLQLFRENEETNFGLIKVGQTSTQTNIKDIAKVASIPVSEWCDYEDGKAYYGTLTAYDTNGFVVATLRVSFTKNIPTAAPEGFSIKTNQVVNGVYNCYLIPMNEDATAKAWAAETAKTGTMKMDQIFNFPSEETESNYTIKFATSLYNDDNEDYTDIQEVAGSGMVVVDPSLINNETKHATTATYNYGKISSEAKDADGNIIEYVVEVPEVNFETVYNCIYNDTYSWAWATREQLATLNKNWMKMEDGKYVYEVPTLTVTYGESMAKVAYNNGSDKEADLEQFIFGVSTKDSRYSSFLDDTYNGSLKIVKDKTTFTSDANGEQEYFKPLFNDDKLQGLEFIPTASNPDADVASTLTITVVDMYGHERVIKIAGVVKRQ